MDSGRCLQTYSLHSEAVRAARWSPCGQRILSGGFDFALHLTDLETGVFSCIVTLRHPFLVGKLLWVGQQPQPVYGFRAVGDSPQERLLLGEYVSRAFAWNQDSPWRV